MKQSLYPEIERTLLEMEESIKIENGPIYDDENGYRKAVDDGNPENLLSRIQKIYQLILKVKYKEIHNKLSERETEIIQQICNGRTTDEMAKLLNLSKHTVESHRTNIFSKLDVRNAAELVALAFRVGLVW